MRPGGSAALLIVLMPAVISAAAEQESGATSATASIFAIAAVSSPESPSDSYWYGRFGYGTIAGYGGVSLGFGRRIERNAFGIDVLVFSGQAKLLGNAPADLHQIGGLYTHAYSASVMTITGLYFVRPRSRTTAYVGAGAGWRAVTFGTVFEVPDELRSPSMPHIDEQWHGKGLEGELTVGYALARAATSTRFFVQADITRPFYRAKRYSNREVVTGDRYAPSLVVSFGAGW
jgi:hypothetical protein